MKTLTAKTTTIRIPNLKKFLFKTIKKTQNNKTMKQINSTKANNNKILKSMKTFKVV